MNDCFMEENLVVKVKFELVCTTVGFDLAVDALRVEEFSLSRFFRNVVDILFKFKCATINFNH